MANDTISSALGLSDEWFDDKVKRVSVSCIRFDKVSDVMVAEAEELRTESLGEVDFKLSEYELKLVALGYIIGLEKFRNQQSHEIHVGGDMPKELIEILAKIIMDRKKKGEE